MAFQVGLRDENEEVIVNHNDFVRTHAVNYIDSHSINAPTPEFLTWHRWWLLKYESALQAVSKDCSITLPFWETEAYSGREEISPPLQPSTFGSVDGVEFTGRFRGQQYGEVSEGIAKDWTTPVSQDRFPSGVLERSFGAQTFSSQAQVLDIIQSFSAFQDFFQPIEGTPHAVPHNWVGRQMANVQYSPEDPLFVLHHTNVDKWFALWQDLYYPNGITDTKQLAMDQFSGDIDVPMLFEFEGVTDLRSGPYFQLDGNYPTPRQVLLLDDDNINVVYEEDDLAQILVQTTAADENSYDPNARSPQVWFTLPSQTTSSTSATETSTTVSSTTTPQPPSTTTELPATTTASEFVTFFSLSDSRVPFI